ncbi:conserved hypothetical protein [Treponema primitia ZAS-2]|uniref:DUF4130 domain-containing protein n=1 Tax=Treponema primitia (strain ATCC BAA-887 / DSM 12427 / ZAS-2) TaxID=545694 RepID=F5YJY8_TREPZ|nr:TIGR03915 family putative DNA repair protein [Treponema primitia]AEF86090.1 conserved hypothetical protein [Treponema primitia ZAS-2]
MIEYTYDGSLEGLFDILETVCGAAEPEAALPSHIRRAGGARGKGGAAETGQLELFDGETAVDSQPQRVFSVPASAEERPGVFPARALAGERPAVFSAAASAGEFPMQEPETLSSVALEFQELSADAFDRFVYGWMSELPIEAELIHFAWNVLAAGRRLPQGAGSPEARAAAEQVAADRGDPVTQRVLEAAYKVWKEIDRLRGLLRFSPNAAGIHIARCAPDHFVLPGLGVHFTLRFGETPWAIIDEARGLGLFRLPGEEARILGLEELPTGIADAPGAAQAGADPWGDPWEGLWQNYHRSVTNESRINPQLQRQFMPRRYWKYLPELREEEKE